MLKKLTLSTIILVFYVVFGITLVSNYAQAQTTKKIGIILPLEHAALNEIVKGFKDKIGKIYSGNLEIIVKNAQNDSNMQRLIIDQFKNNNFDIIIPLGTITAQMTINKIKNIPIVSLAAYYHESDRKNHPNVTNILDEFDTSERFDFIQDFFPKIKNYTLIYSSSEKTVPEVNDFVKLASRQGHKIQKLMVQNLSELFTVSKLIDKNSKAIVIFKDNMIVSGIKAIVNEASKKSLPIITLDEGSVKEGASIALGVKEYDIGAQGADYANKILNGIDVKTLPITTIKNKQIFLNEKACNLIDCKQIKERAKKLSIKVNNL